MARDSIVTSIKVDEGLWRRAKKRAIDEGITLQELLNQSIQEYLRRAVAAESRRRKTEN